MHSRTTQRSMPVYGLCSSQVSKCLFKHQRQRQAQLWEDSQLRQPSFTLLALHAILENNPQKTYLVKNYENRNCIGTTF